MQPATSPAPSLPWSWYVEQPALDQELSVAWRGAWHYVGHASLLGEVGSQLACRALAVPVLLVRDEASSVRAFVNTCRHRGSLLVAERACAKSIRCPYHAWTYALDGRLRGAPRLSAELPDPAGTDDGTSADGSALADQLSLVPLRLESWGPFLFVALDDEAPALVDWLGHVPERVAAAGVDVAQLQHHARVTGEVAANWKVVCENYLECYHCQVAHPGFSAVVDVREEAYELESSGRIASQYGPRREPAREASRFDASGSVATSSFHFVFPNLVVNVMPGAPNLSLGTIVPCASDRTWRLLDYAFPPEADGEWVRQLLAWDEQVGEEDRVLVEAVQAGMSAAARASGLGADARPRLEKGFLLPRSERLVTWFSEQVRGAHDSPGVRI